jgi:uroporphyrinogen decarboxylase
MHADPTHSLAEPPAAFLIPPIPSHSESGVESPAFLAACRREATPFTPVWLMRQAGRYMPEYRAVRDKLGFLELCKRPEAAAEVTVTAARLLGVDAAIIFADILLVVEPLGLGLTYGTGDGPRIERPLRAAADVERLPAVPRRWATSTMPFGWPAPRSRPGSR